MGQRRSASVLRPGMRVSTRLVPVRVDRGKIRTLLLVYEIEAYAELFAPDVVVD